MRKDEILVEIDSQGYLYLNQKKEINISHKKSKNDLERLIPTGQHGGQEGHRKWLKMIGTAGY